MKFDTELDNSGEVSESGDLIEDGNKNIKGKMVIK